MYISIVTEGYLSGLAFNHQVHHSTLFLLIMLTNHPHLNVNQEKWPYNVDTALGLFKHEVLL